MSTIMFIKRNILAYAVIRKCISQGVPLDKRKAPMQCCLRHSWWTTKIAQKNAGHVIPDRLLGSRWWRPGQKCLVTWRWVKSRVNWNCLSRTDLTGRNMCLCCRELGGRGDAHDTGWSPKFERILGGCRAFIMYALYVMDGWPSPNWQRMSVN